MKLRREKYNSKMTYNFLYGIILLVGSISITCIFIIHGFSSADWYLVIPLYFLSFSIIIFSYNNKTTIISEPIKQSSKKIPANIVETGDYKLHEHPRIYYIVLEYENKLLQVDYMLDDDAFSILKLLLDPYPLNETIKIPIDIYIHKKQIYIDFDSLDLTKIKGYEEAKKAFDSTYP